MVSILENTLIASLVEKTYLDRYEAENDGLKQIKIFTPQLIETIVQKFEAEL